MRSGSVWVITLGTVFSIGALTPAWSQDSPLLSKDSVLTVGKSFSVPAKSGDEIATLMEAYNGVIAPIHDMSQAHAGSCVLAFRISDQRRPFNPPDPKKPRSKRVFEATDLQALPKPGLVEVTFNDKDLEKITCFSINGKIPPVSWLQRFLVADSDSATPNSGMNATVDDGEDGKGAVAKDPDSAGDDRVGKEYHPPARR